MRFYFGFAGIPSDIYEDVERENKRFAQGAEFCIDKMPNFVGYAQRNIDYFVERFHAKVAADQKNSLLDTGFAIIYLERDANSTARFVDAFFPHTLMVPVHWQLDVSRGKTSMRESKNALIPLLEKATVTARAALRALTDEVVSRASSTPILLPVRNFHSTDLTPALRGLHSELASGQEPLTTISARIEAFKRAHPPKRIDGRKRDCFIDTSDVEYHPPGNHRHAFARAGGQHPRHCLLSGRRRLGAPYDPLFHYDCSKGNRGKLEGNFFGCHEDSQPREGNPHLNVAPNDHVRG